MKSRLDIEFSVPKSRKIPRINFYAAKPNLKKQPEIFILADFPPPIQGLSIVNTWVTNSIRDSGMQIRFLNTSVNRNEFYSLRRIWIYCKSLKWILKISKKDRFYVPLSHGLTLIPQSLCISIARMRGAKTLVHHHSYLPLISSKTLLFNITHGFLLKKSTHIFLSENMRNKYVRKWNLTERAEVMSNHGVAFSRVTKYVNPKPKFEKITLTHMGRLSEVKGTTEVINLCYSILRVSSKFEVNFLGPCVDPIISDKIQILENRFPGQVFHNSQYDSKLLSQVLSKTTIFLFPSRYRNEASPLVVLEAQAAGAIVFSSDVGCLTEDVISPGQAVPIETWNEHVLDFLTQIQYDEKILKQIKDEICNLSEDLAKTSISQFKKIFEISSI